MEKTINVLELADVLATQNMNSIHEDEWTFEDTDGVYRIKPEHEDEFNNLYDFYYNEIVNL
jgi:hypothetical protein